MENQIDLNVKYSVKDYLSWKDISCELIDGAVKLMSGVTKWHNDLTEGIHEIYMKIKSKGVKCYRFRAPFDVFFSDVDVVQPDYGIVLDLSKVHDNGIYGAPDFIVEILSPSSIKKDMVDKFKLYEKYGVKEYWIIEPRDLVLYRYIHQGNGYNDGECFNFTTNSKVKLSILDIEIDLKDLLET